MKKDLSNSESKISQEDDNLSQKLKQKIKELEQDLKYLSHNFMIVSKQLQISKLNLDEAIEKEKINGFNYLITIVDLIDAITVNYYSDELNTVYDKIKEIFLENEVCLHQTNKFDPSIHQIVEKEINPNISEEIKIDKIIQKGYSYRNKIIRMSKIKIVTNK